MRSSVWAFDSGTINQFATALSEAGGGLSQEEHADLILAAIWKGEFEGAMSLPEISATGVRQFPSGSFAPFWRSEEGDEDVPPPREDITREDLRHAFAHNDPGAKRQKVLPEFDLLASYTFGHFEPFFVSTYLDRLRLDTAAVSGWLESHRCIERLGGISRQAVPENPVTRRRGGKQRFRWDVLKEHLDVLVGEHGHPNAEPPSDFWRSTTVEKALFDYCSEHPLKWDSKSKAWVDGEPTHSTISKKISDWLADMKLGEA